MTYSFRQGIDYGPRKGALGLGFHMSEGGDGLVSYLAKRSTETVAEWKSRVRGVSAHACILSDGTVWQMVHFDNAAGSMNPSDRATWDKGYYGGKYLRAVLGDHYVDPNAYSIVCEIAGYRADGPTGAQVKAAIDWGRDMASRYPSIRGAFGHADQTDTKGCPGTTAAMKAIFEGLGGHGLWLATPNTDTQSGGDVALIYDEALWDVAAGKPFYDSPGGKQIGTFSKATTVHVYGTPLDDSADHIDYGWRLALVTTAAVTGTLAPKLVYVKRTDLTNGRDYVPPAPPDDTPYDEADLNLATAKARAAELARWETWVGTRPK